MVSGILALLCVSIVGFYFFDIWQFALTFWYLAFWYSTILAFCVGIFAFSAFLPFGCHLGRRVGLNAWRWQVDELKPADRYRDLKAILKAIAVGKEEANPNAPSGASTAAPLAMTFIVLSRFGLFDFGCKTGLPIRMRKNTRNVNRLTFSGLKTKKRKICLDALTDSSSY